MQSNRAAAPRIWASEMPVILALTLALYVLGDHSLWFTVSDPLDIDSLHTARVMGDPLRRIGYIALIGGALYAISRMPSLTTRPHRGLRRCVVFTVSWMALSVAWSQITALSLKDLGVALIVWLSCAAIGPRLSLAGIRKTAILYNGCAILLGLLCEILLSTCHPFSSEYRFSGTVYANIQGVLCGMFLIGMLCSTAGTGKTRIARAFAMFAATVLLLLTQSRDAMLATAVAIMIYAVPRLSKRSIIMALAGACLFSAIVASMFLLPSSGVSGRGLASAATLERDRVAAGGFGETRLALWEECLPFVAQRPLLGYGYASFWSEDRVSGMADHLGFIALHAHNGYLDVALNTGLIGCTVFVTALIMALGRYLNEYRATSQRDFGYAAAVLGFFVTHMLFESFYVTGVETILAVCVLMQLAFAGLCSSHRAIAQSRAGVAVLTTAPVAEGMRLESAL